MTVSAEDRAHKLELARAVGGELYRLCLFCLYDLIDVVLLDREAVVHVLGRDEEPYLLSFSNLNCFWDKRKLASGDFDLARRLRIGLVSGIRNSRERKKAQD